MRSAVYPEGGELGSLEEAGKHAIVNDENF